MKILDKILKFFNLERISKKETNIVPQLKEDWKDSDGKVSRHPYPLGTPRMEIRWRDCFYEEPFLDRTMKSSICDLCLVYSFNKEERYDVLDTVKSSDLEAPFSLRSPNRMLHDAYALMYQLNIPVYITYKNQIQEIYFPKNKLDLALGVQAIMKKEDLDKMD